MAAVFKLQGSDVYEVLEIEHLVGPEMPAPSQRVGLLAAVRAVSSLLAAATDLRTVLDDVLAVLASDLGIDHSMVLLIERGRARLYTVASRGYPASGVGSEIPSRPRDHRRSRTRGHRDPHLARDQRIRLQPHDA